MGAASRVIMSPRHVFALVSVVATALVAACAPTHPGAHPRDMSAAEHREHAAAEDNKAEQHEEQYDPTAEQQMSTGGPADSFTHSNSSTYNPTDSHLKEGAGHRDDADEHRDAAEALEDFENEECAKLPPKTRRTCPLLGQLASADNTKDGVRITPADGVNREAMLAHMRCHLAYAATRGFEGMDACPLYIKGVSIEESDGAILLEAKDAASIKVVQQRTATHVK
jgi:hypothetical protein